MKVRIVAVLAVCIMALLAVSVVPAQAEEIMYLTSWQGSPSQINWNIIDYVMYAFSVPDTNGNAPVPGGLSGACSAAHAAGKKCLLSYGGWNNGDDSGFEALAASSQGRTNFANACAAAIAAGADGCDLDWEYPEQEDSANYAALIDVIRARIGSGKLITAAAANHGYNARAVQDACKTSRLDYAMIMS
jgi:chitinase